MKKLFSTFIISFMVLAALAQVRTTGSTAEINLLSTDQNTTTFVVRTIDFEQLPVQTPKGPAVVIRNNDATQILEAGAPDLPKLATSITIGATDRMTVNVVSSSFTDFQNINVAPSKGNLYRDVDPATVPYNWGSAYQNNRFFPGELVSLREPHIIRDLRGQTVVVYPYQYNPMTKVLRVYNELIITVEKADNNGANVLSSNNVHPVISPEFDQIYRRHFINYDALNDYTPVNEEGNMLVISYGDFMPAMEEFVEWKNTIGIPTEMVNVGSIGSTSTAIADYIENYYNTNGLTFVLLVGDNAQIPTMTGGNLGGPSDVAYGYILGNDHYPEVFVGRFSAENLAHVETQVRRTIDYEKTPQFTSDDWYTTCLGIGSDQGPGDDNEYDYQHQRNIQVDLMGYNYTWNPELFDGSQGGNDAPGNPNASSVSTEVNAGTGIITYTGHGSTTSWGTTGFSNSSVNSLQNQGKLPFIWSVACVNGEFMNTTCFAEAWLRASQSGVPTGAVAFLGSTINQSWDPPMAGQDEMVDILVESYPANIRRTFGALSMEGCMLMNDEYGSGGNEMTDTWLIFGDPSVVVRTDNPTEISANHNPTIFLGSTSFVINSNANGARAVASVNGEILGSGIVTNGQVEITFNALTNVNDTLTIALTQYNRIPYLAEIPVIPANGPYVIYNNNQINDVSGNNNQQADYSETLLLNIGMKNIGVEPTTDAVVKLRTDDPYITLIDSTENYGAVPAGQVVGLPDAFTVKVADNVPDGHMVTFKTFCQDNGDEWASQFTMEMHAPALNLVITEVLDPLGNNNGRLDPGETADIKVRLKNGGSAAAYSVIGTLATGDPFITVNSSGTSYGDMEPNSYGEQLFNVTVAEFTPGGHSVNFELLLNGEYNLQVSQSFDLVVGRIPVLVIDLDGNTNSGPAIQTAVQSLSITADYTTTMTSTPELYQSIFICLGTSPNAHVLTTAEAQKMVNFLNGGGRLYMEGGDTWHYDQISNPTNLHPMFNINGKGDNGGDITNVIGKTGTFAEGMNFTFSGDENYIDKLEPKNQAFTILSNQALPFDVAIANDASTYKTIGSSLEFGGLTDATLPSTKQNLMQQYLTFFGIERSPMWAAFTASTTTPAIETEVQFTDLSSPGFTNWEWTFEGGSPATSNEQNPRTVYPNAGLFDVSLTSSNADSTKTTVKYDYICAADYTGVIDHSVTVNFTVYPNPSNGVINVRLSAEGTQCIAVELVDALGKTIQRADVTSLLNNTLNFSNIPSGLYVVRVITERGNVVQKVIVR